MSRDIFDDPARYDVALAGFSPTSIASVLAFHAAVTGIGMLLAYLLPDTVAPHGGQYAPAWLALACQVPLTLLTARLFATRARQAFWFWSVLLSVTMFVWLGLLTWAAPPFYAVVLATLFVVWAYHDAWTASGHAIAPVYLAAAPAMDIALLAVDAAGGRGLIWAFSHDYTHALAFVAVQIVMTASTLWLIRWVGREVDERARLAESSARLERALSLMAKEREVVQTSSALIANGLVATKFSHDLAGPVAALRLTAEELGHTVHELANAAPPGALPELVRDVQEAVARIDAMAGEFALAVRRPERPSATAIGDLVERAQVAAAAALGDAAAPVPTVVTRLRPADVWIASGHGSSLANILTNCALHAPGQDIDLVGGPAGGGFYRLTIRDRGVAPEARAEALARIRRSLALEPVDGARAATYRGLGVGLMLAKVYVTRHGGWLSCAPPGDEGPGVEFELLLPLHDPTDPNQQSCQPQTLARSI